MTTDDTFHLCERCEGVWTRDPLCRDCMEELHPKEYPSDFEWGPLVDDEDARDRYYVGDEFADDNYDLYGPDYETWQGDGYDPDDQPTVKLTLKGRFYLWRTYILPDYPNRARYYLWRMKWEIRRLYYKLMRKNPYDDIPF